MRVHLVAVLSTLGLAAGLAVAPAATAGAAPLNRPADPVVVTGATVRRCRA